MRVKLILFVLFIVGLLLVVSCTSGPEIKPSTPAIYIVDGVEEPQVKTFIVTEDDPLAWFEETKERRYQQNLRRFIDEYEEELEEFEFESHFANVRRIVYNDLGESELIIGYDKELDNPDFEEVDY